MSIDYEFQFDTHLSPLEVLELIVDSEVEINVFKDYLPYADYEFTFVTATAASASTREILFESLDIMPTVVVTFQLKSGSTSEAMDKMFEILRKILSSVNGNFLYSFYNENPILLRKDGVITLNRLVGYWREERLAQFPFPYIMADMPFI